MVRRLQVGSSSIFLFPVVVGLCLLSGNALAMTYYLGPSGQDGNNGTSTVAPWKTFDFAVSRLQPGDTLVIMNGSYTKGTSGHLTIIAKHGSSSSPITLKAEDQRLAHLAGDGITVTMRIDSSSYLVFDGLQVSSEDRTGATVGPDPVSVRSSHHLVFKNMLLHHSNRHTNSHLMTWQYVADSLIEDSEFYYFHRHALLLSPSDKNTIRRVYCNSRGYGAIPGGYPNGHGSVGGDGCIVVYPGNNNLVENVISDGPQTALSVQALGTAQGNRFYGVIALNPWYGVSFRARGMAADYQPLNNWIKDLVVVNAESVGVYTRGNKATRCEQCTIIGSGNSGMIADVEPGNAGDGISSFYSTNSLLLNNAKHGIGISGQSDWLVEYSNSFNNVGLEYVPQSSPKLINNSEFDPRLGTCRVYIPDNSPLKRSGKNGGDIGANVLYRYQDGRLTNIPLWDLNTGRFPCGAVVSGINNIAGASCSDVHQRLNINMSGCGFPSNYGNGSGDSTPPSAPQNLKAS